MKIVTIIIRVLLGLLFVFGAVVYFLQLVPQPELTGDMKTFQDGMNASGYLMPIVKAIELICGIAFITGRFVALATVIIFPIVVNILLVHSFLAPSGLPVAVFVLLSTLLLAYVNKGRYKSLVATR